jgi:hypothetical protein
MVVWISRTTVARCGVSVTDLVGRALMAISEVNMSAILSVVVMKRVEEEEEDEEDS